ncbi:MAG: flagellin [Pirellulaceae bacterium]
MLRVGTRLSGIDLRAQQNLLGALGQLAESSNRLATMKRINRGSDDPAGLIALETLRSEIVSLEKASEAADRSRALVRVADSGLDQATRLVNEIQGAVVTAASGTTSDAERAALQLEVDAALEALDRIGDSTSIFGRDVLQGGEISLLTGSSPTDQATLELPEVSTTALGDETGSLSELRSGGAANLIDGDLARADELLDAARIQLVEDRARLGAFERYTIDSTQAVIDTKLVNLTDAASRIGDTDAASESARLARSMILVESSSSAFLAGLAHHRASMILLDYLRRAF